MPPPATAAPPALPKPPAIPGDAAVDRLHVDVVSAADAGDSISRFDDLVSFAYPLPLPPAPAAFEPSFALGAPLRRRRALLLAVEWELWSASSLLSSLRSLPSAAGFFAQSSPSPLLFTIFPTTQCNRGERTVMICEVQGRVYKGWVEGRALDGRWSDLALCWPARRRPPDDVQMLEIGEVKKAKSRCSRHTPKIRSSCIMLPCCSPEVMWTPGTFWQHHFPCEDRRETIKCPCSNEL